MAEEIKEISLLEENVENQFFNEVVPKFQEVGADKTQISYLYLALIKKNQFPKLQAKELEAQEILLNLEKVEEDKLTITLLTEELEKYRNVHKTMKENIRLPLTRYYDKVLYKPAKDFEDRVDFTTNKKYKTFESKLKQKRLKAHEEEELRLAKEREKAKYITHIITQYLEMEEDFVTKYKEYISDTYTQLLRDLVEKPDLESIKATIRGIPKKQYQKYPEFKYLSVEECLEISNKAKADKKAPTSNDVFWDNLLNKAYEEVDKQFKMYIVDLNNAKQNPKIVDEVKKDQEENLKKVKEIYETNKKIESTYSKAVPAPSKPEGKAVTKVWVVVEENSFIWDKKVMDAFMRLPEETQLRYMRSRTDWPALDVRTMASVLSKYATETNDQISTLQYEQKTE